MTDALAVLSFGVALFPLVRTEIINYMKGKAVKKELYLALQEKINRYQESFQKIIELSPNEV
jgi:hypothetical protein